MAVSQKNLHDNSVKVFPPNSDWVEKLLQEFEKKRKT